MKSPFKGYWGILFLATVAIGGLSLQAQEYAIRLDNPQKAGLKYTLSGEANESTKNIVAVDGAVLQQSETKTSWQFAGKVEVKEVSVKGLATKLSTEIQKFTVKEEGEVKELLPAGTVIISELKEGEEVHQVKGKDVSEEAFEGLKSFVTLNDPDEPSDDDISGTKEKKKVGDTWPLNSEMMVKSFSGNDLSLRKDDVQGTTKLDDVVTVEGQKYLKIISRADFKNVIPPLPPGMKIKKSSIQAQISGLFPVTLAGPRLESTEEMKMDLKAEGKMPDGKLMEISVVSEKKSVNKIKVDQ